MLLRKLKWGNKSETRGKVSVERDKCIVIVVNWAGWRVEEQRKRAWSVRVAAREWLLGQEWQLELEYQEVGKVWGGTWGALWYWTMHLGLERKMEQVEGFGEA